MHDLGLFQLDGNAAVEASPAGEDWNSVVGNGTGSLPLAGSNAISATFVNDPYNVPNGDSAYGAGSSKDIDDVPSWSYTLAGNVNDKLDFEHAGAALYVASNGDPILYFFADRYAQNGDAKVGFWFFKGSVGLEPSPGTHFAGPHQNGDVLIESDFTNGGANISNIVVKEWQNGALSAPLGTGGDCKTAGQSDELCGTNSTGPFGQLWSFEPKAQSTAGSFFEGGINLATLFGGTDQVPCFSSFLAHSRTSGETADSELKDFVFGEFNTCGTITVVKSATPKDNTPFSFTTTARVRSEAASTSATRARRRRSSRTARGARTASPKARVRTGDSRRSTASPRDGHERTRSPDDSDGVDHARLRRPRDLHVHERPRSGLFEGEQGV